MSSDNIGSGQGGRRCARLRETAGGGARRSVLFTKQFVVHKTSIKIGELLGDRIGIVAGYSQGAVRILDLLDARNQRVTAHRRVADSIYGVLIEWINVQRALSRFDLSADPKNLAGLVRDAQQYRARRESGMPPRSEVDWPPPNG